MHAGHISLLSLPDELIEAILTISAADGDVGSIAALAATSKRLSNIVYDTTDQHLWRSFLLTTYDDPRNASNPRYSLDWRQDFQDRSWTRLFIQNRAKPVTVLKKRELRSGPSTAWSFVDRPAGDADAHVRALDTLMSVIHTAAPAPTDVRAMQNLVYRADDRRQPADLVELHSQTSTWPPEVPLDPPSRNISWLRDTLANGLPLTLTNKLSLDNVDPEWHNSPEGLAIGQVISHLGFLPVPIVESTHSAPLQPPMKSRRGAAKDSSSSAKASMMAVDMSEQAQRQRALWYARPHAFDLSYLSRRRHWGPYLPVYAEGETPFDDTDSEYVDDSDADPDSDDPDWEPPNADVSPTLNAPPPEKLLPDWSWLAAARIVAECTLRAHQTAEDIQKLELWDNLRAGTWIRPVDDGPVSEDSDSVPVEGAHGEDKSAGGKNERDWAGVEGVHRRLVCWLGYEELLYHNAFGGFDNPALSEAWIIVPLSLRITGYSPSPLPQHAARPTIHVSGSMGGAGWQGSGNVPPADEDVRRVHGSVSMLADGCVRWSLTSSFEDGTADEWASEAVQLGGVGSAAGALGMWTGAGHDEDDPLGVFWQWRVG
ncbi:hypothetical protein OH77DRAFT_1399499 [Trametes cingulata]|nr:hypothetical protein OH77DRAFT_1399499 [Trametes cingulata]